MLYAVVAYPKIESNEVDDFRHKYDPHASLIRPHITIVFPFKDEISEAEIIKHIENKIKEIHSFQISVEGYDKFFDHWLYLTVKEGYSNIKKLHDVLYTDILGQYLRKDIPFIPHITIGLFSKKYLNSVSIDRNSELDEERYQKAITELNIINPVFKTTVENITLVRLDDKFSVLQNVMNFNL